MKSLINFITDARIRGQLRHVASAVGTVLAVNGYVNSGTFEVWLGLAMAVIALYDSWTAKEKKQT